MKIDKEKYARLCARLEIEASGLRGMNETIQSYERDLKFHNVIDRAATEAHLASLRAEYATRTEPFRVLSALVDSCRKFVQEIEA